MYFKSVKKSCFPLAPALTLNRFRHSPAYISYQSYYYSTSNSIAVFKGLFFIYNLHKRISSATG